MRRPSATKKRTDRPVPPPTASRATGIAARRRASRAATTLRSPICTEPGVMSCANMLAPPTSLATRRRGSAPSALRRSTSNGTAVSGNLAGWPGSRARLREGSRMCAIAPAHARGSWSMIATQEPRPRVTRTSLPRAAAQSAIRTTVSWRAASLIPRRAFGKSAREAPRAPGGRAPGRTASRLCRARGGRPSRARRRTPRTAAPASAGRSRSRRCGKR